MTPTLKSLFRIWQKKHPNFMTNKIIKLFEHKGYIIEISEGRGIVTPVLYGVTLAAQNNKGFTTWFKCSGCVDSYSEALIKVDAIKNMINDFIDGKIDEL